MNASLIINELRLPQDLFPFRKVTDGFRYLEILVTNSFTELFAEFYHPLLDCGKLNFVRWSSVLLSLTGQISLVKMVVFPQFLYVFQHIPLFINKSLFVTLDQLMNSFFWWYKCACIIRSVLQLPRSKGGLALPNFRHYHWAIASSSSGIQMRHQANNPSRP